MVHQPKHPLERSELVLFEAVFVGVCWLGTLLLGPYARTWLREEPRLNDMLAAFLQYFGVIYGLLAGTSGFVIKYVGFVHFFFGTSLLGIPVALLAWYVLHKHGMATWTAQADTP